MNLEEAGWKVMQAGDEKAQPSLTWPYPILSRDGTFQLKGYKPQTSLDFQYCVPSYMSIIKYVSCAQLTIS